MKIYDSSINGSESLINQSPTFIALINFYKAFNQRNLDLIEQNWLNTDEISMSNPLGGIRRGWNEIREIYKRIFLGQAKVFVEFYDYTIFQTAEIFLVAGRERGFIEVGDSRIDLAIRTSRIYTNRNSEWRQIHHHGSIETPSLLKKYQTLVNNK